ncbi:hypothetical protein DFQ27_001360, partial [Actinomortierella ambigua]
MSDFNIRIAEAIHTQPEILDWLGDNMLDCLTPPVDPTVTTFSDNSLLRVELKPAHHPQRRKTTWRLNTQILKDKVFGPKILEAARTLAQGRPGETPQERWDRWKPGVRSACIRPSAHRNRIREDRLQELKDLYADHLTLHAEVDKDLQKWCFAKLVEIETEIQTIVTENLQGRVLKASCGYFFRSIAARSARRRVPELLDPVTNRLTNSVDGQLDSTLYTPEDPDGDIKDHTARMVSVIPDDRTLSDEVQAQRTNPIETASIRAQIDHSPRGWAPGRDGLPFELYRSLLSVPEVATLLAR